MRKSEFEDKNGGGFIDLYTKEVEYLTRYDVYLRENLDDSFGFFDSQLISNENQVEILRQNVITDKSKDTLNKIIFGAIEELEKINLNISSITTRRLHHAPKHFCIKEIVIDNIVDNRTANLINLLSCLGFIKDAMEKYTAELNDKTNLLNQKVQENSNYIEIQNLLTSAFSDLCLVIKDINVFCNDLDCYQENMAYMYGLFQPVFSIASPITNYSDVKQKITDILTHTLNDNNFSLLQKKEYAKSVVDKYISLEIDNRQSNLHKLLSEKFNIIKTYDLTNYENVIDMILIYAKQQIVARNADFQNSDESTQSLNEFITPFVNQIIFPSYLSRDLLRNIISLASAYEVTLNYWRPEVKTKVFLGLLSIAKHMINNADVTSKTNIVNLENKMQLYSNGIKPILFQYSISALNLISSFKQINDFMKIIGTIA